MIFESRYRRQALESWKQSNPETKKEIVRTLERKKRVSHNPLTQMLASIAAYFSQ